MKEYGTERICKKFAFLPTVISIDDIFDCSIWFSSYYIKQRWVKEGSNRIRMRGFFKNYYYDGWIKVGMSLTKDVKTWRKYR